MPNDSTDPHKRVDYLHPGLTIWPLGTALIDRPIISDCGAVVKGGFWDSRQSDNPSVAINMRSVVAPSFWIKIAIL